jgi:hypothetical protein
MFAPAKFAMDGSTSGGSHCWTSQQWHTNSGTVAVANGNGRFSGGAVGERIRLSQGYFQSDAELDFSSA